jgi:hypothetical protein
MVQSSETKLYAEVNTQTFDIRAGGTYIDAGFGENVANEHPASAMVSARLRPQVGCMLRIWLSKPTLSNVLPGSMSNSTTSQWPEYVRLWLGVA